MIIFSALPDLLSPWGISLKAIREDLNIAGSPERTCDRVVVEDSNGALWILEEIPKREIEKKCQILSLLDHLAGRGFEQIVCYRKAIAGSHHVLFSDGIFQLLPFRQSIPLDRPAYVFEGWRGPVLAEVLIAFRKASASFVPPEGRGFFSLKTYVRRIRDDIAARDPHLMKDVSPILAHLEEVFFPVHDDLPRSLGHGDFHPLNILWGPRSIHALIDWEFFGIKPEGYDAANLVGCLGMEDPASLGEDLVLSFLHVLTETGFFQPETRASFPDLVLALRFAWLAEWLRKKDLPMIDLELTYMHLLLEHQQDLMKLWRL